MIAIQAFLVIAGFGGLVWAMVAWMVRANRREHEIMARRHEEWMANGSNPTRSRTSSRETAAADGPPALGREVFAHNDQPR
jgi:hypothetical protein